MPFAADSILQWSEHASGTAVLKVANAQGADQQEQNADLDSDSVHVTPEVACALVQVRDFW